MRAFWTLFWSLVVLLSLAFLSKDTPKSSSVPLKEWQAIQAQVVNQELLEKIQKLALEKRVGQLMIVGFATTVPDEHIQRLIREYGVGGVNLLKRNVTDAEQVRKLTGALQSLTATEGLPPLFIGVDQEGEVNRFRFLAEQTPQKELTGLAHARKVAERRGEELRALGVNMNFSPVLDYVSDTNAYLYDRTFATSTEASALLGI